MRLKIVVLISSALLISFLTGCSHQSTNQLMKKGDDYLKKGQADLAIAEYTKAIEMNPKLDMAYLKRGGAYQSKWDFGLAIKDYTMAIEVNPRFASAYIERGRAYGTLGHYERALADINKAIEINPSLSNWLKYITEQIDTMKAQEKAQQSPSVPQYSPSSK